LSRFWHTARKPTFAALQKDGNVGSQPPNASAARSQATASWDRLFTKTANLLTFHRLIRHPAVRILATAVHAKSGETG
jgi:hypothetical protein